MALEQMPIEILDNIIKRCSQQDLFKLLKVSRTISAIAQDIVYQYPVVDLEQFACATSPEDEAKYAQRARHIDIELKFSRETSQNICLYHDHPKFFFYSEECWERLIYHHSINLTNFVMSLHNLRKVSIHMDYRIAAERGWPGPDSFSLDAIYPLLHAIATQLQHLEDLSIDLRPTYINARGFMEDLDLDGDDNYLMKCFLCPLISAKLPALKRLYLRLPILCADALEYQPSEESNDLKLESLIINLANHTDPRNLWFRYWSPPRCCGDNLRRHVRTEDDYLEMMEIAMQKLMRHAPHLTIARLVSASPCPFYTGQRWQRALPRFNWAKDLLSGKEYSVKDGDWASVDKGNILRFLEKPLCPSEPLYSIVQRTIAKLNLDSNVSDSCTTSGHSESLPLR